MSDEHIHEEFEKDALFAVLSEAENLAKVGGWEWDVIKNKWTFSDSWLRIHGCSKRHLETSELLHIAHPDDRPDIQKAFDLAITEGADYAIEHRIIRQDTGEERDIKAYGRAELDSDGTVVKIYGAAQDITEMKRTAEALRESEELLSRAQEIAHTGSWRLDLTTNRLTWSDEVYRIFGCEPQKFAATYEAFLDFVHPDDRAAVDGAYSRSQQEGSDGYEIEHRIIRRNSGEVRYVHERCVHKRDAAGITTQSTGMVQDITERKRAEEENRRFRTISDNAVYGKAIADLQGNLLYVNRFFANIHGYEPGELIGKHLSLFHSRKQTEAADRLIAFMMREGHFAPTTAWHRHRDGAEFPMLMSGVLIKDDYGNPQCIAASAIDITAHHQAEESLRESEQKHRRLFETMAQGIIYQAADGAIVSANPAAERILGLSFEQMRGKTSMDPRWKMIFEDGATVPGTEHPAMIALRTAETVGPVIRGVFHPDKHTYVWLSITAIPLFQSGETTPFQVYATFEDVTERRQAIEALKEREAFIKATLDNLPVGIAVNSVDPKVHFTYMNENFATVYRTTREALAAPNDFWEVVYTDATFREEIKKRVLEDCASNDPARMHWEDVPVSRPGEKPFYITAKNIPVPGRNMMVSTVWDNTERKQAETAREKLQAKLNQAQKMESVGRLAGGVAHDFNNMLGVILGHVEFAIEKAEQGHDLHADLKEIQKAARRSADLTKQLLAFARKQIIDPKVLDLNNAVESMLTMLRRLLGEDIDLSWSPARPLWPVKMDPSQIDQILANLCVNARDAISGVGKLTIETGRKTFDEEYCKEHPGFIPGDFVLLAVSDNGCGMDKDTLENLFEPFFTTKEVGKGTGLGLATIYGIVKQNNGFINVYSEPGQGSTFKIYLRRLVADTEVAAVLPEKKAAAGGTETILLVEDEPSLLEMTRMMLEMKGYNVLSAATPAEAMAKATSHSGAIDLLMTDVVMPKMNGRDLAGKITALYPGIRLLFMSGYTSNVIAHRGILDDGVAFIQKPFSMADMTAKVRVLLDMAPDNA